MIKTRKVLFSFFFGTNESALSINKLINTTNHLVTENIVLEHVYGCARYVCKHINCFISAYSVVQQCHDEMIKLKPTARKKREKLYFILSYFIPQAKYSYM